jgi:hypothetical protein
LIITITLAVRLLRDAPIASGTDPAGRDPALIRAVQVATVLPICALTLATGGDDLVILGLCLLGFGYAARDRFGAAGLVVGLAGAMKLFAWPVALVLLALAVVRAGRPGAFRFGLGAIGLPVLTLVPAVFVNAGAAIENVVKFPLGRGLVASPAESPFPGHLIAAGVPGGKTIATGLLLVAAAGIGLWLLRTPPRSAATAAVISAWGLLAAIAFIPATRFGYLLYPAAYAVWAPALRHAAPTQTGELASEASMAAG